MSGKAFQIASNLIVCLIACYTNENHKTPHHWFFVRGSCRWPWIPFPVKPVKRKAFPCCEFFMNVTSYCNLDLNLWQLIVNWILCSKFEWNRNQNTSIHTRKGIWKCSYNSVHFISATVSWLILLLLLLLITIEMFEIRPICQTRDLEELPRSCENVS